jgi:hypothetical protein
VAVVRGGISEQPAAIQGKVVGGDVLRLTISELDVPVADRQALRMFQPDAVRGHTSLVQPGHPVAASVPADVQIPFGL